MMLKHCSVLRIIIKKMIDLFQKGKNKKVIGMFMNYEVK